MIIIETEFKFKKVGSISLTKKSLGFLISLNICKINLPGKKERPPSAKNTHEIILG